MKKENKQVKDPESSCAANIKRTFRNIKRTSRKLNESTQRRRVGLVLLVENFTESPSLLTEGV